MKSNLISKGETASLLKKISEDWGMEVARVKNLRVHHILDDTQIVTGDGIKMLNAGGQYVPFLSETGMLEKFPSVTVDMGAVKFVCGGADVMRPGIKGSAGFEKGQIVCVVEESQKKFLAVGRALVSSAEMEGMGKGRVLKNIHYISDRFWEAGKTIHD